MNVPGWWGFALEALGPGYTSSVPATAQREERKHKPSRCPAVLPTLESEREHPRQSAEKPQTFRCCSEDPRWPWESGGREGTHDYWQHPGHLTQTHTVCCGVFPRQRDTHHGGMVGGGGSVCLLVFSTGKCLGKEITLPDRYINTIFKGVFQRIVTLLKEIIPDLLS